MYIIYTVLYILYTHICKFIVTDKRNKLYILLENTFLYNNYDFPSLVSSQILPTLSIPYLACFLSLSLENEQVNKEMNKPE